MQNWLLRKITSRKFWVFIGVATATTVAASTGQLAWSIAVKYLTAQILVYLGVEGGVDIARTICGPKNRIVYDPSVLNPLDVESNDPDQPIRVRRAGFGRDITKSVFVTGDDNKKGVS